jgi:hypothetical protein
MATQSAAVLDQSFKAENDLSAKQYHLVELSAEGQVDVCDGATDRVLGALLNKPKADEAAAVRMLGVALVVSDGSSVNIGAGDYVGPNTSGKAVKKATADYSVAGIALAPSTADGTVIPVFLTPGAFFRTAAG